MSRFSARHYIATASVIGVVALYGFTGCDNDKEEEGPLCEVIDSPAGLYCNYENPFTHTSECKAYIGTGWDQASIDLDCATPMGGIPTDPGVVTETQCDVLNSLGSCTFEGDEPNREFMLWFFFYNDAGEIAYDDVGVYQRGCENMMPGTFCNNLPEEIDDTTTSTEMLEEGVEASKSNDQVKVTPDEITDEQREEMRENGGHIFFEPVTPPASKVGIIIYPGGRIDSRSYAPAAQMLAKEGYYVAIFPMPEYMAMGDAIYRAGDVMAEHTDITSWFMTGHSMGGTAAGQYMHNKLEDDEADQVKGLVIMGSYMDGDHDLSGETLPVLMMFGTEERIANADKPKYDEARVYLPEGAIHFPVQDGFHFGFSFSENNRDDEQVLITHQEQHDIFVPEIVTFIEGIM